MTQGRNASRAETKKRLWKNAVSALLPSFCSATFII